MGILALSGKLTLRSMRRILLFTCLTALLCITAGLLGNSLLYGEKALMEPVRVALVDEDDTAQSRMLIRYLTDLEGYEELLAFTQMSRAEADDLMRDSAFDAILLIPREFVAGVMDGRNMPFSVTLQGDSELRSSLIRLFAGIYADMLRTGQIGVYACLAEAREVGDDAYAQMFRDANLRFFTAMVSGRAMMGKEELSATERGGALVQYGVSTLVFLMMTGGVLFLDLWNRAASRPVLMRLRALGASPVATGFSYLAGASLPFLLSGVLMAGGFTIFLAGQSGFVFAALPLFFFALLLSAILSAALMMAAAGFVGGGAAGCVYLFMGNLFCLFVSGGILPSAYLSPFLRAIGSFTPHLWMNRLLLEALAGEAQPFVWILCAGWAALFSAFAILGIWRRGKAGKKP